MAWFVSLSLCPRPILFRNIFLRNKQKDNQTKKGHQMIEIIETEEKWEGEERYVVACKED